MVIRAESKTENRSSSIGFGEFTREMNRLRSEHGAALVAGENWQWPAIVSDQDKRLTDRLVPLPLSRSQILFQTDRASPMIRAINGRCAAAVNYRARRGARVPGAPDGISNGLRNHQSLFVAVWA
jgi:hypothetical protein